MWMMLWNCNKTAWLVCPPGCYLGPFFTFPLAYLVSSVTSSTGSGGQLPGYILTRRGLQQPVHLLRPPGGLPRVVVGS